MSTRQRITDALRSGQFATQSEVAAHLNCSSGYVSRVVADLRSEGLVAKYSLEWRGDAIQVARKRGWLSRILRR